MTPIEEQIIAMDACDKQIQNIQAAIESAAERLCEVLLVAVSIRDELDASRLAATATVRAQRAQLSR